MNGTLRFWTVQLLSLCGFVRMPPVVDYAVSICALVGCHHRFSVTFSDLGIDSLTVSSGGIFTGSGITMRWWPDGACLCSTSNTRRLPSSSIGRG